MMQLFLVLSPWLAILGVAFLAGALLVGGGG
jgi:hypothetical protein